MLELGFFEIPGKRKLVIIECTICVTLFSSLIQVRSMLLRFLRNGISLSILDRVDYLN